ncbi:MAG: hypothetical protein MK102_07815 [Fuerstiella sp.]|nr:hypothetical protein [Fuerstiella sp.]
MLRKRNCTVVKLGGSLLDLKDLTDRLIAVVADFYNPVVVVGGGPAADRVRQWHEQGVVDSSEAHQLSIAAMSFNAINLACSDRRMCLVSSQDEATAAGQRGEVPLIDCLRVLQAEQESNLQLPAIPVSWDVTSDSISAWLAQAWGGELCLLKSVDAGPNPAEHLDGWFLSAFSNRAQLTWLNLRSNVRTPEIVTMPVAADESH